MSRYTQYFGKNNVKSELAVGISSIATTIQVNENQGNLRGENFPVLGTLEHFDSTGKVSKREIVKVESKSGDTFTVVRKFAPCPPSDDATSQTQVSNSFDPGDSFSIYIPYEILNAVSEAIQDLYNNGNDRLFAKKTSGLGFEITPGNVRFENGEAYYSGGTGIVVDNSVNYIMLDSGLNIIVSQEELLDVQNISIAEITAVNGEITQIVSKKIDSFAGRMGGGGDPVYGDGSDGDLVISENTILNAGQQYQFSNLYICSGATVSFTGCGGAKIRVANTFINEGIIDTTDIDVDEYCYYDSTSYRLLMNCARGPSHFCPGRGGKAGFVEKTEVVAQLNCCYMRACGQGNGGNAIENGTCCCVGAGGTYSSPNGQDGYNCGAGGGAGQLGVCVDCSSSSYCRVNGCPGSGFNGGNGGNGCLMGYYLNRRVFAGGGGGGGFFTGNGGNGGNASSYGYCSCGAGYLPCYACGNRQLCNGGGDGGNGGILGNGGNGGNGYTGTSMAYGVGGGNGGDGLCHGGNGGNGGRGHNVKAYGGYLMQGAKGGNGGVGFYGGNGGNGGNTTNINGCGNYSVRYCTDCFSNGGDGGNGGMGIVPGTGGDGGQAGSFCCGTCSVAGCGGIGGQGGTGFARLHSLNIKAKCFCNTGCILSVGSVGGQGGKGGNGTRYSSNCLIQYGGQGGRGGAGGQGGMIQIITDEVLEKGCISVAGGIGGQGGKGGYNLCLPTCETYFGCDGEQGPQGQSGTLYFFVREG